MVTSPTAEYSPCLNLNELLYQPPSCSSHCAHSLYFASSKSSSSPIAMATLHATSVSDPEKPLRFDLPPTLSPIPAGRTEPVILWDIDRPAERDGSYLAVCVILVLVAFVSCTMYWYAASLP